VRGVIPAKAAAVLQPMTRLEIITPPNDDSHDELEDFVDIPERDHKLDVAQHDSMEPKCAEDVNAASHSYSFLPYWMTQFWRGGSSLAIDMPPTPCDVIHKRSLFESYFLNEKLSRVLRLQIDTGSDQPFSCRIARAALDSQATTTQNAAFFARLMPVPASCAEGDDAMTAPLPILVRVSSSEDQLLGDRLYLPPAWLRWQGVEVGTPVYLESMARLADGLHKDSIVEQVAVLRIQDVYTGSRILIFIHPGSRIPDLGSRNSDPGCNKSNKREG
jgi:hypothetical protein